MVPEVATYFEELRDLNAQAIKIVRELDPRALDYAPGPGLNSPGAIVTHMAGSQKEWIGQRLAGRNMHRDREAEFRAMGTSAETLSKALDDSLALAKEILETVTPEMLGQMRQARDRQVTVRYILAHVLSHTALHVGHLEITRQLWESRKI